MLIKGSEKLQGEKTFLEVLHGTLREELFKRTTRAEMLRMND